jgi:hypothetical protein
MRGPEKIENSGTRERKERGEVHIPRLCHLYLFLPKTTALAAQAYRA